ncbi:MULTISPECIES: MBL fold metallo-hydrolase [unclassified Haladaptatus]|uniref:MBL fold metallo-hydrolase n=1 Tax=unclassified Haladaptatus TaxID=2622732 RepID=UPI0023E7B718|nr:MULTISPECIES: MBL fold metallo-hydrolase [unclassified Haladaptatus]
MRLTFLGTGSAMPTGERNQTGILLESNGERLLVDCGSGVLNALARTEAGYEAVDTVLLTHHHLDHIADLLPLLKARWLAGEESLTVVGPQGTADLVSDLLDVHDYLKGRVELELQEVDPDAPFTLKGFDITARETIHSMYCLAYRFTPTGSDGPVFTFSGDSEAIRELAEFAEGSAVLAHDCSFPDEIDVSNHPTPSQLGESLAGLDIGRVYLTHLYPHTDGKHREMLDSIGKHYEGDVRFAKDGLSLGIDEE